MGQPLLNIKNFFGMLTMGGNKSLLPDFCREQQDMIANRGFCKTRPGFSRFDPTAQAVGSLGPLGLFQFRRKNGQWSTLSFSDDGKMYDWPDWFWNMGFIGGFSYPSDVFYDSASEYLYIADTYNNRIVKTKINGDGWTVLDLTGLSLGPWGIYYDSASEYIYFTDQSIVAEGYSAGIVKTKIDGTGWVAYTGPTSSEFSINANGGGIWYDSASEYIYVANGANDNVVKTKIDGTGFATYGTGGSGVGQFNKVQDVQYDSSTEYLHIVDDTNHRIVKTKFDGTGWTTYGTTGTGVGNFKNPKRLFFDSATGYIRVSDYRNDRIVMTKIDGTGWDTISGGFGEVWGLHYNSGYTYGTNPSLAFKVKF